MDLVPHRSVAAFFQDALTAAMRNQGVDTSEMTEFYLVNLLSEFTTTTIDEAPLALKMAEATVAPPELRARQLREVGDHSLYVSGFFSDSLQRSLVDVHYYIQIGGTAYGQLARMPVRGVPGDVYEELAQKFDRIVDVLAEVSEGSLGNSSSTLQLYERYLRTGSAWIARKLRARGMLPALPGDDVDPS